MKKEELIQWAVENGWKLDRWGHLQKRFGEKCRRLKLGKRSVRYEVRLEGSGAWQRVASGYYSGVCITLDGFLSGLSH